MKNPFFYLLLLILVVLTGWLMAHPNLIGRAGIFVYEYDYLATFPRALGVVAGVVAVALVLSWGVGQLTQPVSIGLLTALAAVSIYWLVSSINQFTSGVYKLTGAGFRAGAMLLPGLVVAVFAKHLYEKITNKSHS
ncbi:MAG: hypothetical protein H7Z72_18520 [Bacteroidetes bacterium]|nr:hypothetical protein [Fibrella sp.]